MVNRSCKKKTIIESYTSLHAAYSSAMRCVSPQGPFPLELGRLQPRLELGDPSVPRGERARIVFAFGGFLYFIP